MKLYYASVIIQDSENSKPYPSYQDLGAGVVIEIK